MATRKRAREATSMVYRLMVTTVVMVASVQVLPGQTPDPPAEAVVRDVTVVDVEQGRLLPRRDIVVRGTRITAVVASGGPLPSAKTSIDGRGKFVMPGLIDGPVRLGSFSSQALRRLLAAGVTAVVDVGTAPPTLGRWRRDLAVGRLYAPRLEAGCPGASLSEVSATSPARPDAIHDALASSRSAGRSPAQALRAVTVDRARAICAGALGVVMAGHPADFVVLSANPLDDVRHSRAIDAMVFRGEVLTRAHLNLLAQGSLPLPTPP